MKIIIDRNFEETSQSPIITIDTKTCYYPNAIRQAIQFALEMEGHSKETINEVFGIMPDVQQQED